MGKRLSEKMKKKLDRWFLLNWKRFVISALIFIIVFFFRNRTIRPIFEPLGIYSAVFYVISIGIPVYLLFSFFYTILIRKMKFKKSEKTNFFLLSWKKAGVTLIIWVVAVVIHNLGGALISAIFEIEFHEPLFFLVAVIVIPLYFIVCVVYSLIRKFYK